MASTPFTKLLHTHDPDASCGSLVIQAEFNNTRCTYRASSSSSGLAFGVYFPSWSTGSSQDTTPIPATFACTPSRMLPLSSSSSTSPTFALRYICRWMAFPSAPRRPLASSPTSSPPPTPNIPDTKVGVTPKSPLTSTTVVARFPRSVTPPPPTPLPISVVNSSSGRTILKQSNGPTNSSDESGNGRHGPSQSPILHGFSLVTYAPSSTSALHLPLSYVARNDAARQPCQGNPIASAFRNAISYGKFTKANVIVHQRTNNRRSPT